MVVALSAATRKGCDITTHWRGCLSAPHNSDVNAAGLRTALWRCDLDAELPLLAGCRRSQMAICRLICGQGSKTGHTSLRGIYNPCANRFYGQSVYNAITFTLIFSLHIPLPLSSADSQMRLVPVSNFTAELQTVFPSRILPHGQHSRRSFPHKLH